MKDILWAVTVNDLAVDEIRAMKALHADWYQEVAEVMLRLAMEPDPRRPRNRDLNVVPLRDTRGEWYRVRSLRLGLRVVFRILQKRGQRLVEVHQFDRLADTDEQALQICHAGPRQTVYLDLGEIYKERRKAA
jgi:hypothetical protein